MPDGDKLSVVTDRSVPQERIRADERWGFFLGIG
jgi:hypothetical protein